jgi:CRP/FNR family transcriptional regulator, cyclic AMP receptor protein
MSALQKFYKAGQILFKEGQPSECMYLIKRGKVSVRRMRQGNWVEIASISTNEVLGELSFFDRRPRSATAIATTEVEAMVIDFASLDKVYKEVPEYLRSIISSVAERLRRANETIRKLKKETVDDDAPADHGAEPSEASGETSEDGDGEEPKA